MTVELEAPRGGAGRKDGAGSAPAGLVVGSASTICGTALLLAWLQQRIAPSLLRLPPVPFFDKLVPWDRLSAMSITQLAVAVALLVAGAAVLGRHRWAPLLFTLLGWGGLAFTVAAAWPGDGLRFKMRTAVTAAQKYGVAGSDATFWDLVPARYAWGLGAFVVLWLALLLVGTVHLLRARDLYDR